MDAGHLLPLKDVIRESLDWLDEHLGPVHAARIEASGLEHEMHAYGTNNEGEWDDVFATIKQCHEAVHEMGAPRISTTIKLGTRIDREQSMQDKLDSVQAKL